MSRRNEYSEMSEDMNPPLQPGATIHTFRKFEVEPKAVLDIGDDRYVVVPYHKGAPKDHIQVRRGSKAFISGDNGPGELLGQVSHDAKAFASDLVTSMNEVDLSLVQLDKKIAPLISGSKVNYNKTDYSVRFKGSRLVFDQEVLVHTPTGSRRGQVSASQHRSKGHISSSSLVRLSSIDNDEYYDESLNSSLVTTLQEDDSVTLSCGHYVLCPFCWQDRKYLLIKNLFESIERLFEKSRNGLYIRGPPSPRADGVFDSGIGSMDHPEHIELEKILINKKEETKLGLVDLDRENALLVAHSASLGLEGSEVFSPESPDDALGKITDIFPEHDVAKMKIYDSSLARSKIRTRHGDMDWKLGSPSLRERCSLMWLERGEPRIRDVTILDINYDSKPRITICDSRGVLYKLPDEGYSGSLLVSKIPPMNYDETLKVYGSYLGQSDLTWEEEITGYGGNTSCYDRFYSALSLPIQESGQQ